MGIRKKIKIIIAFILSLWLLSSHCLSLPKSSNISTSITKTSTPEFPDKVYAFLAPSDMLTFEDLYFEEHYTYFIWVELVTPHNCTLTITLWDPEGKQFDLFGHDLYLEPEGSDYHEIPFGCALGGNYTIQFRTNSDDNLNIHIRIEKWIKCLYDKILSEELQGMILYDVTRFYDGMIISPTVDLKTDYKYRFYFGRVSAISATESSFVSLNFSLIDPGAIEYTIYANKTLEPVTDVNRICFGTATEGEYTVEIEIKSDVAYTNIGYTVIDLHRISHLHDPNQTDPTNSTSPPPIMFRMPIEWTVGLVVFFGVVIAVAVIVIVKSHNKNALAFKER